MRNLKKILALVLALVMSLSLMATASAAETTAAASDYALASKVLQGLDVVRGDDGGIREADSITRAEAAALAYRIHTADVTDSKANLYYDLQDAAFTDLAPVSAWALGYIGYAHNAQIVKGNGNGTFNPTGNITGYEILAMALRSIGYGKNGEFEGAEWQINTAAWARREGLLEGVSPTDQVRLDLPATRGMVFQILFNAIQHDDVQFSYTTPDLYVNATGADNTMALRLGLDKITGVVMANEWADLENDSVLADGKTRLKAKDGTDYTVDHASELEDIGESRIAYIRDDKTVLDLADAGNDVKDNNGEEKTVSSLKGSLTVNDTTRHFRNFAEGTKDYSEWIIRYVITAGTVNAAGNYVRENWYNPDSTGYNSGWVNYLTAKLTGSNSLNAPSTRKATVSTRTTTAGDVLSFTVTIQPNEFINSYDLAIMKNIFYTADRWAANPDNAYVDYWIDGEVYVGTSSLTDQSDIKSWTEFENTYLKDDKTRPITEAGNGEWLKIIDNDGDGVAEYVLLTQYVLDKVVDSTTKNDTTTYYYNALDITEWTYKTHTGYEPKVGDIVLYALIDGTVQMQLADTATATFRAVNYKERQATDTNGDVKEQSDIFNETKLPSELVEVDENIEYTLYLDKYGYVRAYSNETRYALITEVYPTNGMNQAWVTDRNLTAEVMKTGEKTIKEYRIENNWYSNNYNPFYIGDNRSWTGALNTSRSNWLKPATHSLDWSVAEGNREFIFNNSTTEVNHSWTNVAKYTPGSDENSINLFTAADRTNGNRREDYIQLAVQNVSSKDPLYAINDVDYPNNTSNPNNHYVRAVDDTVFFVVSRGDRAVRQYVGYSNVVNLDTVKNGIHAMYAVAVNSATDTDVVNYWTADVIVIEIERFDDAFESVALIYSNDTKISGDVKYLQVLDSAKGSIGIVPNNVDIWRSQFTNYGFWGLKNVEATDDANIYTADIYPIHTASYTDHYDLAKLCADYGIYFGRVRSTDEELERSTYITVDVMGNENSEDVERTTTIRLADKYGAAWSIDDASTYYNEADELIFGGHGSNRVNHGDYILWVNVPGTSNNTVGFIVDLSDKYVTSAHTWDNPSFLGTIARRMAIEQTGTPAATPDDTAALAAIETAYAQAKAVAGADLTKVDAAYEAAKNAVAAEKARAGATTASVTKVGEDEAAKILAAAGAQTSDTVSVDTDIMATNMATGEPYTLQPIEDKELDSDRSFTIKAEEFVADNFVKFVVTNVLEDAGYTVTTVTEGEEWKITVEEGFDSITLVLDYDENQSIFEEGEEPVTPPETPDPDDDVSVDTQEEEDGTVIVTETVTKPDGTTEVTVTTTKPDGTEIVKKPDGSTTITDPEGNTTTVIPNDPSTGDNSDVDVEDWDDEEAQTLSAAEAVKAKKMTITVKAGFRLDPAGSAYVKCTGELKSETEQEDGSIVYIFKVTPARAGISCTIKYAVVSRTAPEEIPVEIVLTGDGVEGGAALADYVTITLNEEEVEDVTAAKMGDLIHVAKKTVEGKVITVSPERYTVTGDEEEAIVITVTVRDADPDAIPVVIDLTGEGVEEGKTWSDYVAISVNGEEAAGLETASAGDEITVTKKTVDGKVITVEPESVSVTGDETEIVITVTVENAAGEQEITVNAAQNVTGVKTLTVVNDEGEDVESYTTTVDGSVSITAKLENTSSTAAFKPVVVNGEETIAFEYDETNNVWTAEVPVTAETKTVTVTAKRYYTVTLTKTTLIDPSEIAFEGDGVSVSQEIFAADENGLTFEITVADRRQPVVNDAPSGCDAPVLTPGENGVWTVEVTGVENNVTIDLKTIGETYLIVNSADEAVTVVSPELENGRVKVVGGKQEIVVDVTNGKQPKITKGDTESWFALSDEAAASTSKTRWVYTVEGIEATTSVNITADTQKKLTVQTSANQITIPDASKEVLFVAVVEGDTTKYRAVVPGIEVLNNFAPAADEVKNTTITPNRTGALNATTDVWEIVYETTTAPNSTTLTLKTGVKSEVRLSSSTTNVSVTGEATKPVSAGTKANGTTTVYYAEFDLTVPAGYVPQIDTAETDCRFEQIDETAWKATIVVGGNTNPLYDVKVKGVKIPDVTLNNLGGVRENTADDPIKTMAVETVSAEDWNYTGVAKMTYSTSFSGLSVTVPGVELSAAVSEDAKVKAVAALDENGTTWTVTVTSVDGFTPNGQLISVDVSAAMGTMVTLKLAEGASDGITLPAKYYDYASDGAVSFEVTLTSEDENARLAAKVTAGAAVVNTVQDAVDPSKWTVNVTNAGNESVDVTLSVSTSEEHSWTLSTKQEVDTVKNGVKSWNPTTGTITDTCSFTVSLFPGYELSDESIKVYDASPVAREKTALTKGITVTYVVTDYATNTYNVTVADERETKTDLEIVIESVTQTAFAEIESYRGRLANAWSVPRECTKEDERGLTVVNTDKSSVSGYPSSRNPDNNGDIQEIPLYDTYEIEEGALIRTSDTAYSKEDTVTVTGSVKHWNGADLANTCLGWWNGVALVFAQDNTTFTSVTRAKNGGEASEISVSIGAGSYEGENGKKVDISKMMGLYASTEENCTIVYTFTVGSEGDMRTLTYTVHYNTVPSGKSVLDFEKVEDGGEASGQSVVALGEN